jgi:hypothetical protein
VTHQEDVSASRLHSIHWIGPFARRIGQVLTQILSLLFDFQRAKSRFRGFLSSGHATNDEMATRQRHFLMAHLLVTALRNLADRWQLLAPF